MVMDQRDSAEVAVIMRAFQVLLEATHLDGIMVVMVTAESGGEAFNMHVTGRAELDRLTSMELLADLTGEAVAQLRARRAGMN